MKPETIDVSQFNEELEDVLDCEHLFPPEQRAEIRELAKQAEGLSFKTYVSKPKPSALKQFVIAFTDNLEVLAELGLTTTQLKIMLYLLKIMEYGNLVILNRKAMAKDLKMYPSNLSANLKGLEAKGVLLNHEGHTYLNSNLFAKGLKSGMKQARRENLENAKSTHGGIYQTAFK